MENEILNLELLKRIFGNLGAVPGDNFGKHGLTTEDHIIDKTIKFEEEGKITEYLLRCGEINCEGSKYHIILVNLKSLKSPEFIAILNVDEGMSFGFSLQDDMGAFSIKYEEQWVGISMLHKLNLTAAIEMVTQEGLQWAPSSLESSNYMYDLLISLLAIDV